MNEEGFRLGKQKSWNEKGAPPASHSQPLPAFSNPEKQWNARCIVGHSCSPLYHWIHTGIHNRPYRLQPSNAFIIIPQIWGVPRNFTAFFLDSGYKEMTVGSRTEAGRHTSYPNSWTFNMKIKIFVEEGWEIKLLGEKRNSIKNEENGLCCISLTESGALIAAASHSWGQTGRTEWLSRWQRCPNLLARLIVSQQECVCRCNYPRRRPWPGSEMEGSFIFLYPGYVTYITIYICMCVWKNWGDKMKRNNARADCSLLCNDITPVCSPQWAAAVISRESGC